MLGFSWDVFCYIFFAVINSQKIYIHGRSYNFFGGHQHSREYISLELLYFLDPIKKLTSSLFPWRLNPQGNHLWWLASKVIESFLALYICRSFLESWSSWLISLHVSWFSLKVFFGPQEYYVLWYWGAERPIWVLVINDNICGLIVSCEMKG